ncbi:hypothetical protein C8R45DRAFT_925218 [Mycena sanguinolenta]|nr:hypothetical protein C8R45DRAFT_925218 [Mycena sanguinolenta]
MSADLTGDLGSIKLRHVQLASAGMKPGGTKVQKKKNSRSNGGDFYESSRSGSNSATRVLLGTPVIDIVTISQALCLRLSFLAEWHPIYCRIGGLTHGSKALKEQNLNSLVLLLSREIRFPESFPLENPRPHGENKLRRIEESQYMADDDGQTQSRSIPSAPDSWFRTPREKTSFILLKIQHLGKPPTGRLDQNDSSGVETVFRFEFKLPHEPLTSESDEDVKKSVFKSLKTAKRLDFHKQIVPPN